MPRILFKRDRCKGCGLCVGVCPEKIIFLEERVNNLGYHPAAVTEVERCIGCTLCGIICPDMVIEVFRPRRAGVGKGDGVGERGVQGTG